MLAKILEDMWVEPEVLEALSEEQKRILFLKMREEQVRRWRVREEMEEKEGREDSRGPKQADKKHVRWLLGRDGDVSVSVIGEVDEFRSSRLLQSLMNNRVHSGSMNVLQPVELLPGGLKEDIQEDIQLCAADVSCDPPSSQSQEEEEEEEQEEEEQEPAEDSDSESGGSSGSLSDWGPLRTPGSNHGDRQPVRSLLPDRERDRGKQDVTFTCDQKDCGGRVSQLRKAFTGSSPVQTKPPLPVKPAHLQRTSRALVH